MGKMWLFIFLKAYNYVLDVTDGTLCPAAMHDIHKIYNLTNNRISI